MTESIINRHKRTDVVISPPDEFHPLLGGDGALMLAEISRPEPAELRQMLRSLREKFGWSQSFAAAAIGVSKSCVVKWEGGSRAPTGAAAKLIFWLHSRLLDAPGKVRNVWDLAFWGRIPCRDSIQQAVRLEKAIGGTYFVSEDVFNSAMGFKSTPQVQAARKP